MINFPALTLIPGGTLEMNAFDLHSRCCSARFWCKSSTNIQQEVTWKITSGRREDTARGGRERAQSYLAGSIVTDWMSVFNSLDGAFQPKSENLSSLFNIWFSHSWRDKTALSLSSHLLKCT